MKKYVLTALVSVGVTAAGLCAWNATNAEEKAPPPAGAAPDKEAMMKAMKAYMTPGDAHKKLDYFSGPWTGKSKAWFDPSAPAEESEASSEAWWCMDGLFLELNYCGAMMGQPFFGRGLIGYNNASKKYEHLWFDSCGSGMMFMTGDYNDKAKTYTFKGDMMCPITNKNMPMRMEIAVKDDNSYVLNGYCTCDGKEMKMHETAFTRVKNEMPETPDDEGQPEPSDKK